MKQLIMTIGNMASGKSTFVNSISSLYKIIIVSRDSLRYSIGNGEYYFGRCETAIAKAEEVLVNEIMKTGQSILLDDASNVMLDMRSKWITIAKNYDYEVIVIVMPKLSMKASVDRRMKSNHGNITKTVWKEVYNKFKSMYEQPRYDENIDKIFIIDTIHKTNDTLRDVLKVINCDYRCTQEAKKVR